MGGWILLALAACKPDPQPLHHVGGALTHQAYIWQYRWTPALHLAIADSAPVVQGWRVLVAEYGVTRQFKKIALDWNALQTSQRPVIAVIRVEGRAWPSDVEGRIAAWVHTLPPAVQQIEVDFDSSTAELDAYAAGLQRVRRLLPAGLRLSITLLPDWLDSQDMPALLGVVDSSVLQLHGVYDKGRSLFDAALAQRRVLQMAALQRPFWIALPNYGSRVVLDQRARVHSIESEQVPTQPSDTGRELFVAPQQMARFLRDLKAPRDSGLQGVVWFRLPLDTDQRIWGRATWHAVMQQHALPDPTWQVQWQATAHNMGSLVVRNAGAFDNPAPDRVRFEGQCTQTKADAYVLDRRGDQSWLLERRTPLLVRAGGSVVLSHLKCSTPPTQWQVMDED